MARGGISHESAPVASRVPVWEKRECPVGVRDGLGVHVVGGPLDDLRGAGFRVGGDEGDASENVTVAASFALHVP